MRLIQNSLSQLVRFVVGGAGVFTDVLPTHCVKFVRGGEVPVEMVTGRLAYLRVVSWLR